MSSSAISLLDHVTHVDLGAYVVFAGFLKNHPSFALGDGRLIVMDGDAHSTIYAHKNGCILVAATDGERMVTGGDDGYVIGSSLNGTTEVIADEKSRWIDALALSKNGAIAWSAGKQVRARDAKCRLESWQAPTSVRGLAFANKGYRLACAHYNGVSLWYPGTQAPPETLEWKGSHIDVLWSPDNRFVISTMQENALHGWRLQPDKGHMRMTGYPAKTRSFNWSYDGKWLATSGAEAVILWPFETIEGPGGKQPRECGVRHAKVSCVAAHPNAYVIAAGYDDGAILMIRLTDNAELMVRAATKNSAITTLTWDEKGKRLAFGCADGASGLLTLPS